MFICIFSEYPDFSNCEQNKKNFNAKKRKYSFFSPYATSELFADSLQHFYLHNLPKSTLVYQTMRISIGWYIPVKYRFYKGFCHSANQQNTQNPIFTTLLNLLLFNPWHQYYCLNMRRLWKHINTTYFLCYISIYFK